MLEEFLEGITGEVGWGVGAAALAAGAFVAATVGKPLAKGAIKGYLALSDQVRQATAGATESMRDLYAEAKQEYEAQRKKQPAAEPAAGAEKSPSRARRIPIETGE